MMISSTSSSMYYMGQMSGMGKRPDPAEKFAKVDTNGSGGLDQTEFQTLADKISEATGEEVDVEALFATYDEDGNGVLNESETQSAMEANRPQGPPPQGPPPGGMTGGSPPGLSQLFSDADEDEDGTLDETETQTLVDFINQAASEEMDAAELLAAHDEDEDGVLSEEETMAALETNRPEGPPPQDGVSAQSEGVSQAVMAGIENYMKMAALGVGLDAQSDMTAMFGGGSQSFASETLLSVNTQA